MSPPSSSKIRKPTAARYVSFCVAGLAEVDARFALRFFGSEALMDEVFLIGLLVRAKFLFNIAVIAGCDGSPQVAEGANGIHISSAFFSGLLAIKNAGDDGLTLPKDVLLDNRFRGMSAERIYNLLEEEEQNQSSSSDADTESQDDSADSGGGSNSSESSSSEEDIDEPRAPQTPGGIGQVLDAPEPESGEGDTLAEQVRDWQIAVEQAENVAKLAGKLPGGVTRSLEAARAACVDWQELLRRTWSETIPADYSWTRSNRRHVWNGLYLPGVVCDGVGEICIAVDCSGSINARQLGLFEAEVSSILAGQLPRLVHVLYFDTEVQKAETYQAGQPVKLASVGGGGTDFRPCFRWLEERGITPQTLVFLTDGLKSGGSRHRRLSF
jgi:hypothetical protein